MLLQDFFKHINSSEFVFSPGVQIFYGPNFPSLLFTLLKDKLKQITGNTIYFLDINNLEASNIKSTLETSFLGSSNIYWLGDLTSLNDSEIKLWVNYFKEYKEPHTVLFFLNDSVSQLQQLIQQTKPKNSPSPESSFSISLTVEALLERSRERSTVKIEQNLDKNLYKEFYKFFSNQNSDLSFIENLFAHQSLISLDIASILIYYQSLLGRKHEVFFADWLDKIVVSEKSLFTLSQNFFAKNSPTFFNLWHQVRETYPDEFWVAYWSDQLWHAIFFIQYMRANMTKEAKYINRLPFAFIQKDWKKCNFSELQNSHKFLYKIDYNLKNSAATHSVDLWLFKYFNNQF